MYRDADLQVWVTCNYTIILHNTRAGVRFQTPQSLEQMSAYCPYERVLQVNEISVLHQKKHFQFPIQVDF